MSCEGGNFIPESDLVRASGDGMTDRRPEQDFITRILNQEQPVPGVSLGQAVQIEAGQAPIDAAVGQNGATGNEGVSGSNTVR